MLNERLNGLVHARWFERSILAVILLAGLLAGLETSQEIMRRHGPLLRGLDAAVLAIFVVELVLRIASYGSRPWAFFRDRWNVFDFVIVAVCLLPVQSQFAAALRLARTLRLLRLVSALPRLQLLAGALLKSLGSMGYVGLLLALVFYIYAVIGVHLFGRADALHFGSLSAALFSLFQIITLDNWSEMYRGMEGVSRFVAVLYFVSFILLGTMIMLNLFIGIIMNSMSEMHAEIEAKERCRELGGRSPDIEAELERLDEQAETLRKGIRGLRSALHAGKGLEPSRAPGAHSTSGSIG